MRSLAGSLADGVLADAIFNFFPPINIRKVKGHQKVTETKDACQHLKLATSLHHCHKNKQLKLKCLKW